MKVKNVLRFSRTLIAVISLLLMSLNSHAQDDNWKIIFNGKDFSGWQQLNGKHIWDVVDGVIVGTTVPGEPNGFLVTEKEYGDFILELEVSIDTLMNNSGVQFRTLSYPEYNNGRIHGYQMEVDPKPQKWSGAIYEEGGNRGWIYSGDELSIAAKEAFKRDTKNGYQWNKYRIEAIGTTIRTWVNGVPAAHLIDDKFLRGYIGMQLHANQANDPEGSHKVRFRNIRIQTGDLKPSSFDDAYVSNLLPNNLSTQEELNGYTLLWDGRSTRGWRGPNKSEFPKSQWSIQDGELSILKPGNTSSDNSYIITEKEYGLFELKFDFKISEGANSGLEYFVKESNGNEDEIPSLLEYQIVDDLTSEVEGNKKLGSLADIMESTTTRMYLKRIGEWNRGFIKMSLNNHIEYWLNGNKILEYQLGSQSFKELLSKSKYKELVSFDISPRGHVLLENNGSLVSYRSLKIKELE